MIAQKALNREMMVKERLSCSQARQSVLDSTISPGKRTVTGEMKLIESETLDSSIASFFYENAQWCSNALALPAQCAARV